MENKVKHFNSLLFGLDINQLFLDFEKSMRGHDITNIENKVSALLNIVPKWESIRIEYCNRLIKYDDLDKALIVANNGLELNNESILLKQIKFNILINSDIKKAKQFLDSNHNRFLRNNDGLEYLKKFIILSKEFKYFSLFLALIRVLETRKQIISSSNYLFLLQCILESSYNKTINIKDKDLTDILTSLKFYFGIEKEKNENISYIQFNDLKLNSFVLTLLNQNNYSLEQINKKFIREENNEVFNKLRLINNKINKANQIKNKKVAICISGQAREFISIAPKINELIKSISSNVDVFIASWDKNSVRFPLGLSFGHLKRVMDDNIVDFFEKNNLSGQDILYRYPSINTWVESFDTITQESFKNIYKNIKDISIYKDVYEDDEYIIKYFGNRWLSVRNQLRMYDLINKSISKAINTDDYDVIIRLRPDGKIEVDSENINNLIDKIIEKKDEKIIFVDRLQKGCIPSDSVAIGSRGCMEWYSSLIHLAKFYNDDSFYPERKIAAHKILFDHLNLAGYKLEESKEIDLQGFASQYLYKEQLLDIVLKDSKNRIIDSIDEDLIQILKYNIE